MAVTPSIRNILAFNSGVEEVLRMKQADPSLPRGGIINPSPAAETPALNTILFSPSLGEELDHFFRPNVSTPSLLVPNRYKKLLTQSRQALNQAVLPRGTDRGTDRGADGRTDGGNRILEKAVRFLSDLEIQHRELDSRRSAMNRG